MFDNTKAILIILLGLVILLLLLNILLFVYFAMSMSILRGSVRREPYGKNAKLSGSKRHSFKNQVHDPNFGEVNRLCSIEN